MLNLKLTALHYSQSLCSGQHPLMMVVNEFSKSTNGQRQINQQQQPVWWPLYGSTSQHCQLSTGGCNKVLHSWLRWTAGISRMDRHKIKTFSVNKYTQSFNGPLSGTTRVSRYVKKHSPTYIHEKELAQTTRSAVSQRGLLCPIKPA